MITRIRIQNFKILQDIDFQPTSLNVLVGPNGCGKSSILQSIDFLRAFFMSSIEVYLKDKDWSYRDLPNVRGTSRTIRWSVEAKLGPNKNNLGEGTYRYSITLSPRRYLAIGQEFLAFTPPGGERAHLLRRRGRTVVMSDYKTGENITYTVPNLPSSAITAFHHPSFHAKYQLAQHFGNWVRNISYFLIWDPKSLRASDRGKHLMLGPSGEHLAPMLANLKNRKPETFRRLLSRLKRLFPYLVDISFAGSGRGWGWRSIRIHEMRGGKEFIMNNQQVSDGLLRLLAVTSLLYLDNIPTIVMFEEPENGVHPHFLREIVQVLRELTLRKPPNRTQVFFTTHSPYVLDEFYDHPEQILAMEISGQSAQTKLIRVSERASIEKIKESFTSFGEAWFSGLIGGTPTGKLF